MNGADDKQNIKCLSSPEAGADALDEIKQQLDREEGLSQEGKEQILDFVRARIMGEP